MLFLNLGAILLVFLVVLPHLNHELPPLVNSFLGTHPYREITHGSILVTGKTACLPI